MMSKNKEKTYRQATKRHHAYESTDRVSYNINEVPLHLPAITSNFLSVAWGYLPHISERKGPYTEALSVCLQFYMSLKSAGLLKVQQLSCELSFLNTYGSYLHVHVD